MSETPELRPGPPWAMEEMIAAEPGLVAPILAAPQLAEAATLVRGADPLVLTGCGTSEHAAMAGAALLGARSRDAFEAALDPQEGGVLIGISHEAGTPATLEALNAAAARGARTVLVTALPERVETATSAATGGAGGAASGAAGTPAAAPLVVPTPLRDTSWCHTVGYFSPLLALVGIAEAPDPAAVAAALRVDPPDVTALAGCERLLAVGGGVDEITARELALKIEEGTHVPTTPLGLEKVLHGHLPACDARSGLVLLRFDSHAAARRDARAAQVERAANTLGMPVLTLCADPVAGLSPAASALLSGALALQTLTLRLVMALGTNPDLIRREEEPYRAAAEAAGT